MLTSAGFTHSFASVLVLVRLILYDSLCLLPLHPLSLLVWLLSMTHRLIKLTSLDNVYQYVSFFFDGDFTPVFLLVVYLTLWLQGGMAKDFLCSSKKRTLFSFILFVLAPSVTAHRLYTLHLYRESLSRAVHDAFGNETIEESTLTSHIYSLGHSVTNRFGGQQIRKPNVTVTYKSFKPKADMIGGCRSSFDGLFQNQIHKNRNNMEKGNLELDVYLPDGSKRSSKAPLPIVMFVHGGGWRAGDRHFLSINYSGGLTAYLLEKGYILVSVSYRLLCTGAVVEDMIEDLRDAVRFISINAKDWGGNGDHIIPFGASAGGHLSLVLSYSNKLPEIKGVISLYGPTELREESLWDAASSWYEFLYLPFFIRATRQICSSGNADCFEKISPVALVSKSTPTTLLLHGMQDALVPVSHARQLSKALVYNNVTHALIEFPCAAHSCEIACSSPCSQGTLYAIERFLYNSIKDNP